MFSTDLQFSFGPHSQQPSGAGSWWARGWAYLHPGLHIKHIMNAQMFLTSYVTDTQEWPVVPIQALAAQRSIGASHKKGRWWSLNNYSGLWGLPQDSSKRVPDLSASIMLGTVPEISSTTGGLVKKFFKSFETEPSHLAQAGFQLKSLLP